MLTVTKGVDCDNCLLLACFSAFVLQVIRTLRVEFLRLFCHLATNLILTIGGRGQDLQKPVLILFTCLFSDDNTMAATELLVAMAVVWGLGGRKCGLLGSCLHCSAHSKTLGDRDAWPLVQFLSHPVLSVISIFEQFCLSLSGSSSLSSMLVTNPCIQCLLLEIPRVRDLQWHRMAYDLRGNPGECLFCKPSKESVSRRKECSVV